MKYKEDTVESTILFTNDNTDDENEFNINKLRKIELDNNSDESNDSDVNIQDI